MPAPLYRIFYDRHHRTGARNPTWRFSALPSGSSRFDLLEPDGTCYLSDRRYGAWVEVFRGTRVVDEVDVRRRALFTVTAPPDLRLADTTVHAAYGFGVTGELSTVAGYPLPRAWAGALHRAGHPGLLAWCRHDPAQRAHNVAVFGRAGSPARVPGWRVRRSELLTDPVLAEELGRLGVHVLPVPYDVPVTPVP